MTVRQLLSARLISVNRVRRWKGFFIRSEINLRLLTRKKREVLVQAANVNERIYTRRPRSLPFFLFSQNERFCICTQYELEILFQTEIFFFSSYILKARNSSIAATRLKIFPTLNVITANLYSSAYDITMIPTMIIFLFKILHPLFGYR